MARGLALQPCAGGVSAVWQATDGVADQVTLLLGDAANAAAAVDSGLPGFHVTHVVCVASRRNAQTLEARRVHGRVVEWRAFSMSDWLRPDDEVDVAVDLAGPLAALKLAVAGGDGPREAADPGPRTPEAPRAVLVHCDLGHNRAPALMLAFLIQSGLSLREAYRNVLRVRPSVDPLPPYRRGLRAFELQTRGSSTVSGEEPFAMHISELIGLVEKKGDGEDRAECPSLDQTFEDALKMRNASIEALLEELPQVAKP